MTQHMQHRSVITRGVCAACTALVLLLLLPLCAVVDLRLPCCAAAAAMLICAILCCDMLF
jgi:hypothetical protein